MILLESIIQKCPSLRNEKPIKHKQQMEKVSALALNCGEFAFEEDYLTKYLICSVCDMVMRNPMRLHRCGHTFCDKCILSNQCAICNMTFEEKQPDLTAANLVADSIVKCLSKECPFRGTYQNYINTHKNSCKMKQYDGLNNWMQKVKETLNEANKAKPNQKNPIINCQELEIQQTSRPNIDNNSVLIEQASNFQRFSELKSLIIEKRDHKRIEVESLYNINPDNLNKAMEQMKQFKQAPGLRRCQYGKKCKLMLEEGGCPYIHPQKDPRRQYQLDKWANIPVQRPRNDPIVYDGSQQKDKQDTRHFLNEFFPSTKPIQKKEVEIIPPPFPKKGKKKVIQL